MKLETLLSENKKDYFYIMHLSYNGRKKKELWNYAKEENLVGLDYPSVVKDDWNKNAVKYKGCLSNIWVKQFSMFCEEMKKDDIVLVLDGWHFILGIAKVIGDYEYRGELFGIFFDHIRPVQWEKNRVYEYEKRPKTPSPIKGFNNTLCKVEPGTSRWSKLIGFTW